MTSTRKFEILEIDETQVVYKRIIPDKGRNEKDKFEDELNLTKVTMPYFSEEDLERLHAIEDKISGNYKEPKGNLVLNVLASVKNFIIE